MENNSSNAGGKPLVDTHIKLPKTNMPQKTVAFIQALTAGLAIFFGIGAVFASIATFTKDWAFSVPFIGWFDHASALPGLFVAGFLALIFAVVSFLLTKKLTDAEETKKAYSIISIVFGIITAILIVNLVALIFYSLFALGVKNGGNTIQKGLWLNDFLPIVIMTAVSCAISIFAKKIAAGKIELLKIVSFVALGAGALGFIMVVVASLVGFYGGNTPASNYRDLYDSLYDYLY